MDSHVCEGNEHALHMFCAVEFPNAPQTKPAGHALLQVHPVQGCVRCVSTRTTGACAAEHHAAQHAMIAHSGARRRRAPAPVVPPPHGMVQLARFTRSAQHVLRRRVSLDGVRAPQLTHAAAQLRQQAEAA